MEWLPAAWNDSATGKMDADGMAIPQVTFFHRKRMPGCSFSLESLFANVRDHLATSIRARTAVASVRSRGVMRRLFICVEAMFHQGEVNHVTGDINFIGIFLSRSRTIQTIPDCGHVASTSGLRRAILKLFWIDLPMRHCAYVTTISDSSKQELLKYMPTYDPSKIIVIPVPISDRFVRSEKPFDARRPRILHVGTAPNKNLPRLVEALRGIPCALDVVGARVSGYETLLRDSGLEYTYRTGLSDEEMVRAYQQADLLTFASTYEGFGMPIVEAQAIGRPVVTSNLLSMPFVAGDGAHLVDPYDVGSIKAGVQRVIQDAEYRESLVRRGFENRARFDGKTIAQQYLDLYRRVARRDRGSGRR